MFRYAAIHVILLLVLCNTAFTQSGVPEPYGPQPEVGKPMPDFTLTNVTHYNKKQISLADLRGRWTFLDFWFTACTACIQSFPKINALQKEFKDEVQFILIGINEKEMFRGAGIEKVYERLREKQKLQLVSAYDSLLMFRWGIWAMPHIIVIDPDGIVRHITAGGDLGSEKIQKLLKGEPVTLAPKQKSPPKYDVAEFPGSENNTLVYRSILTKSNGERSASSVLEEHVSLLPEYRDQGIQITSLPLSFFYKTAYIENASAQLEQSGKDKIQYYPELVLELKDSSLFDHDFNSGDFRGLYSYNLAVHPSRSADLEFLKKVFRQELKNIFGFEVTIEKRKMPAWELIAQPGAGKRLHTKGGIKYVGDGTESFALASGFTARNISTEQLLGVCTYYMTYHAPFFDETGIRHNIDIKVNADMTSLNDIKMSLQKAGLDIVKAEREFLVVVIKDPIE
jgi:peroxiredoxin